MRRSPVLFICLGFLLSSAVPCFGQGPAAGSHRFQMADAKAAKMTQLSKQAVASGRLISSYLGDWKTDAFWQGVAPRPSTVSFAPLDTWSWQDRLGDTRRKMDRWMINWGMISDTYLFIRFDMNRVVTGVPDSVNSDGYLNAGIYSQMCGSSGGPILSTHATLMMNLNFCLGDDGRFSQGALYNFAIVQFNDFPISGRDYNTAQLGRPIPLPLKVPTSWMRFPTMTSSGTPTPAWNMVVLRMDLTSLPDPSAGGLLVDNQTINFLFDAELQFKAMAPVILVHGTNADHTTWDTPLDNAFTDYFGDPTEFTGICFSDIDLSPNGPIDRNGSDMESEVLTRLQRVGSKACHLVGHSKGGLDSRAMLNRHYGAPSKIDLNQSNQFEVLSLYTLDTPHRGTVLSDISWNVLHATSQVLPDPAWPDLVTLTNWDFNFLHSAGGTDPNGHAWAPTGAALDAQRTVNMKDWNDHHAFTFTGRNSGNTDIKFYNTAADADWRVRDQTIDFWENLGSSYPLPSLATAAYGMLFWANQVQAIPSTLTVFIQGVGDVTIPVTLLYAPPDQGGATWNDTVVSITSAFYDGGTPFCPASLNPIGNILPGHHSSIKTKALAAEIARQIQADWSVQ